jgi:hypothetical protein
MLYVCWLKKRTFIRIIKEIIASYSPSDVSGRKPLLEGTNLLEASAINERIILTNILRKQVMRNWAGFV